MNKTSLKIQIIFNLLIQIVNYIVPLLVSPYISRVLLDTGIGNYSYAFSITSYFTVFIAFGFDSYGNREVANHRMDINQVSKIVTNIVGSKMILFLVSTCIYLLLIFNGILTNGVDLNIYIALLLVLLGSALDISFMFYGLERISVISSTTFFVNLLYMVSIFCFVKTSNDLLLYTILKSSIHVGIYIILWLFARFKIGGFIIGTKVDFFRTLKAASPYFLPGLIAVFANLIDQTMLGNLASNVEVGYYQQAYKLIALALAMISCLNPIILARISYLQSASNKKEIENKVLKSFQLIMFLGLPSVFGLCAISRYFIPLFYGEIFRPTVYVMYSLIPTIIFAPLANLWMNSYFYPAGKANQASVAMAIGNICNIALNLVLIKKYRACGAAIATSVANIIIFSILLLLSRDLYTGLRYVKSFLRTLVAACIMFFSVLLLQGLITVYTENELLVTLVSICTGVIVYFISCLAIKEEFTQYILEMMKSEVRRFHRVYRSH